MYSLKLKTKVAGSAVNVGVKNIKQRKNIKQKKKREVRKHPEKGPKVEKGKL